MELSEVNDRSPSQSHPGVYFLVAAFLWLVTPGHATIVKKSSSTTIGPWTLVTPDAAFSPRDTGSPAVFLGKMWISNGYPEDVRDLWSSSDGITWDRVLESTPYDLYARLTVYDGKLWAINSSVWSSEDGVNWVEEATSTPFHYWSEVVIHDGKMWVFGNGPEVWYSTDGVNWTFATLSAPYGDRVASSVAAFGGKLWLMGGATPAPGKGFPNPDEPLGYPDLDMHNDVWSSTDGVTWTLVTEHAPWRHRMWFPAQSYAGRLWVMAGYDNDAYENLGDTWYTTDGINWQQLNQPEASWTQRHFPSTWVFNNHLWIGAGNAWPVDNDVWKLYSTIATTTNVVASTNPADYGTPVTLTTTVTPASASGTVTFQDGSTTLGVVPLASGTATFETSTLTAGIHDITASYSGDSEYEASSGTLTLEILPIGDAPEIGKSFDPPTIPLNGTTRLTFTLSNPNVSLALSGVGFVDSLPEGLIVATPNGLTGSCGDGTITVAEDLKSISLTGGTLPANASCTFGLDVIGTTAGMKNNETSNVTSAEGGAGSSAVASLEVIGPNLTVDKTHSGDFTQGDTAKTYTITVNNDGLAPTFAPVTLVDTLPDGLTATTIEGTGWSCTLATLTCTRSDELAASAFYPAVIVTVNVAPLSPATVTNTAHVSGGGEIDTSDNDANDVTTIIPLPNLTIMKTHDGSFAQGQTARTYTITVSNDGGAPTSGTITVSDALPLGLTSVSMGGAGWACEIATLTCTRSDVLPMNDSFPTIILTVDVSNDAPASVVNQATVSGGVESVIADNSVFDPTTVLTKPANVVATAISTSQVSITWNPVEGATNYQVFRSSNNGSFAVVGFPLTSSFIDPALTSNTTYLYLVRATDVSNVGPPSNIDLATTFLFTDDPAIPGMTIVKAMHIAELRTAVNAVRAAGGLGPATYSDVIVAGAVITARPFEELHVALDQARTQLGLSALQYTDATLGGVLIKSAHIREIRSGVK